jgi:hypothetical protein
MRFGLVYFSCISVFIIEIETVVILSFSPSTSKLMILVSVESNATRISM